MFEINIMMMIALDKKEKGNTEDENWQHKQN